MTSDLDIYRTASVLIKERAQEDERPREGETPFYCLLQDDALVTALSVQTDRLLKRVPPNADELVISANVKVTKTVWGNIGI